MFYPEYQQTEIRANLKLQYFLLSFTFFPSYDQQASSTDPYLFDFSPSGPGFEVRRFVSSRPGRAVILNKR